MLLHRLRGIVSLFQMCCWLLLIIADLVFSFSESLVFAIVTVCSWHPSGAGPCHSRHSPWLNGSTSLLWRKHKVCNRGQGRQVLVADAKLHAQIPCPFLPYPRTRMVQTEVRKEKQLKAVLVLLEQSSRMFLLGKSCCFHCKNLLCYSP